MSITLRTLKKKRDEKEWNISDYDGYHYIPLYDVSWFLFFFLGRPLGQVSGYTETFIFPIEFDHL